VLHGRGMVFLARGHHGPKAELDHDHGGPPSGGHPGPQPLMHPLNEEEGTDMDESPGGHLQITTPVIDAANKLSVPGRAGRLIGAHHG